MAVLGTQFKGEWLFLADVASEVNSGNLEEPKTDDA